MFENIGLKEFLVFSFLVIVTFLVARFELRRNKLVLAIFVLLSGGLAAILIAAASISSRAKVVPSPLHQIDSAAFYGKTAKLNNLLKTAPKNEANTRDKLGRTPLMAAAQGGHVKAIRALLAAGANVNAADSQGWTALMAAAAEGHTDAVKILLNAGARTDAANRSGSNICQWLNAQVIKCGVLV